MSMPNDSVFALLVHKVAPFQFDIGYKVSSASIRDQVVRAQMVVRALNQAGISTQKTAPLLICGAGVAGLAAAMEAHALKLPFILIEKESGPGGVLAGTGTRYISPTMYEWPATSVDIHSFPMRTLPILGTSGTPPLSSFSYVFPAPSLITTFAATIIGQAGPLLAKWGSGTGKFLYYANTTISKESKRLLEKTLAPGVETKSLPPLVLDTPNGPRLKHVSALLFTAGMAPESPYLKWKRDHTDHEHTFNSETPGFWAPDDLLKANLGFSPPQKPRVLVVGGGDGAIQDVLRCLVDPDRVKNTLEIWEHIAAAIAAAGAPLLTNYKWTNVEEIQRHILTLEGYTSTGAMWVSNPQIYKDLNAEYRILADSLVKLYPDVKTTIKDMLRDDVECVDLSPRDGFSKCYALNRFLIHLFERVLSEEAMPIRFRIVDEVKTFEKISSGGKLSGEVYVNGSKTKFDLIVSRIGSPGVVYQAIGLSGIKPERAEFGRIPVPLMAPPYK